MTPARIKHYESLGWEFIEEKVPRDKPRRGYATLIRFQSPRLNSQCRLDHDETLKQIRESWLLDCELEEYALQRLRNVQFLLNRSFIRAVKAHPDHSRITITVDT